MPKAPNGGRQTLVCCSGCRVWVRHLYPYQLFGSRLFLSPWHCRSCAGLRYRSEGSWSRLNRVFGPYPRNWTYGDPHATAAEPSDGKSQ
jgi:hypothetical protein